MEITTLIERLANVMKLNQVENFIIRRRKFETDLLIYSDKLDEGFGGDTSLIGKVVIKDDYYNATIIIGSLNEVENLKLYPTRPCFKDSDLETVIEKLVSDFNKLKSDLEVRITEMSSREECQELFLNLRRENLSH